MHGFVFFTFAAPGPPGLLLSASLRRLLRSDQIYQISIVYLESSSSSPSSSELLITRKPRCRKETARCRKCFFRLKFADNIPYKYKISHASKATLQSSKHAGAKHNLTQNQDSKSFKVTCLESVEKQ